MAVFCVAGQLWEAAFETTPYCNTTELGIEVDDYRCVEFL